jgi:NADPH-dependent dioxygenase
MVNELLRRGIDVRWIDARPGPLGTTRAFTVHSRTFEVLEHIGIAHRILEVNGYCPGNRFHIEEMGLPPDEVPVLDFRQLENTRYNFYGKVNQQDFEQILRDHIASQHSFTPEWGSECVSVRQEESGIEVHVHSEITGNDEVIRPEYLIGADGSHSVVRTSCGLDMKGGSYEEAAGDDGYFTMSMMDVPVDGYSGDADWVNYHFSASDWMLITSLPDGNYRLYISGDLEKELQTSDDHAAVFQKGLDRFVPGARMRRKEQATTWKIFRKIAEDYSRGNVFLCGDACHVRSPAGGQGMNCCILDAFNLGWKLAAVIQGRSPRDILDTYREEREPVAQLVQGFGESMHKVLFDHARSIEQRIEDTQDKAWHDECVYGISGISHSYADVVWQPDGIDEFADGPRAGDRAPNAKLNETPLLWLHDLYRHARATLLLLPADDADLEKCVEIADSVTNTFGQSVKPVIVYHERSDDLDVDQLAVADTGELQKWYGSTDGAGLYLVRPDLVIGCRTSLANVAAMQEYLEHWFGE